MNTRISKTYVKSLKATTHAPSCLCSFKTEDKIQRVWYQNDRLSVPVPQIGPVPDTFPSSSLFNSQNVMDSICSFSTESLKFFTVIPDVIRTSQATLLTCRSNSFLSRQLRKEQKELWAHTRWRSAKTSYRFTQTCVVAVQSQCVIHHSFYERINTILLCNSESPAFLITAVTTGNGFRHCPSDNMTISV